MIQPPYLLQEIPEELVIVGAGDIGLELEQMFHRFGSKVTLLDSVDKFLPKEDRDIAESVMRILTEAGLRIEVNSETKNAKNTDDGIEVIYAQNGSAKKVSATHLLLATGRRSNADELKVSRAGIQTNDEG